MHRRRFLSYALALSALGVFGSRLLLPSSPRAQPAEGTPFSVAWLRDQARRLASQPYQPPAEVVPALADIDYDAYQAIRFREDRSLWRDDGLAFQVRLFHLGLYF